MPSVVFAEATWYGSLRGGLQSSSGSDLEYFDGGSRWGIKGSAEASEGLTAVYRFEHKISTKNGSQPGGRLAYAGLSGGFGTITLGQIWNAAYNHAGAITDSSYYFGNATTGYRHGNALSYAHSTGPVSFQLDLVSDGDMNTGQGIDKTEFGMSVALGDIGKLALTHTNQRDTMKTGPFMVDHDDNADTNSVEVMQISVLMSNTAAGVAANLDGDKLTDAGLDAITLEADGTYVIGTGLGSLTPDTVSNDCKAAAKTEATTDDCKTVTAYVRTVKTVTPADATNSVTVTTTETRTFFAEAARGTMIDRGYKNTHIAVEFNVGGVTPYLGHSTKKENGATGKTKTTHYGVSGGLGDTGINFLVAARSVKPATGAKSSPWLFNLSKNLGGGATVIFEHANYDNDEPGNKETAIGLHVSF